jgi:hypothetical protein
MSLLGRKVSRATAFRYLAREKELYGAGKGFQTRPDLAALLSSVKLEEKQLKELLVEEEPEQQDSLGSPFTFQPAWYPELKLRCESIKRVMGFGPNVVAAFASAVHAQQLDIPLAEAWVPSKDWCYWFMHKQIPPLHLPQLLLTNSS